MSTQSLTLVDSTTLERLISGIDRLINSQIQPPQDELDDLVTHEQAAHILGISVFTLYTHSSRGDISFFRRGRKNYYSRKVLAEWIKAPHVPKSRKEKKEFHNDEIPKA